MTDFLGMVIFIIIYLLIIVVSFLLCFGLPAIILYFVVKNGNDTKRRLQLLERKMDELIEKQNKSTTPFNEDDSTQPNQTQMPADE